MGNSHHLGVLLHWEFPDVYSWNHSGHARPYLGQTSSWATDLNFSCVMEESQRVELWALCPVAQIFSKKRRLQRSLWLLLGWTLPWHEPPCAFSGMHTPASSRPLCRTCVHKWFLWAFARLFVAPQWGSSHTWAGSNLQLLVSSFGSLPLCHCPPVGKLRLTRGWWAGWWFHSAVARPWHHLLQLDGYLCMSFLRHLLWVLGGVKDPFQYLLEP